LPLPPGPHALPFIGSVMDMTKADGWDTYHKWATDHGDVVYVMVMGQPVVLLNTHETATDLLVKRSAIYSDRPAFTMASKVGGNEKIMAVAQYHRPLKTMRRWFSLVMGTRTSDHFWALQDQMIKGFIKNVYRDIQNGDSDGTNLQTRIRWSAAATTLRIAYGYSATLEDDPILKQVNPAVRDFLEACKPGWLVNVIPSLRHLPTWFPGASFLKIGKEWKNRLESLAQDPVEFVKEQMMNGVAPLSFTRELLEEYGQKMTIEQELDIKWAAFALFSGGTDTVSSTVYAFYLAMTLHPEIQRRAQAELDRVLGGRRLPNLHDRQAGALPYIDALVKELTRWAPVLPAGIPHVLRQEDEYRGWRIPKGTYVIANLWTISRDETIYPNPIEFRPERFLTKEHGGDCATQDDIPMDPSKINFGYGKRGCPGRHLAELGVWLSVAMSLAVYNINVIDGHIPSSTNYERSSISRPRPFKCHITIRSQQAEELIRAI
ncbi:cytochrome P450, partial [Sistotremastrum niveocremeum HHB9708]